MGSGLREIKFDLTYVAEINSKLSIKVIVNRNVLTYTDSKLLVISIPKESVHHIEIYPRILYASEADNESHIGCNHMIIFVVLLVLTS